MGLLMDYRSEPLAVLGCFSSGPVHLYNAAIARKKECDRLAVMATELKKMGAKI